MSSTPRGDPVDPDVAMTTDTSSDSSGSAASSGRTASSTDMTKEFDTVDVTVGTGAIAGPEPSSAEASAGRSASTPAAPGGTGTRTSGRDAGAPDRGRSGVGGLGIAPSVGR